MFKKLSHDGTMFETDNTVYHCLFIQGLGQRFDEGFYLVADSAIAVEFVIFVFEFESHFGRVVESDVYDLGAAGEHRAGIVGVAAYGNDIVQVEIGELVDMLRFVAADVDACLSHDFDGVGVEPVSFDARGEDFDLVAFQMAGPPFGHLAAA